MLRNSILGALASVAGLKAAEALAVSRRSRVIRRPPPAPPNHKVGAFAPQYRADPARKGARRDYTYRYARRNLAKLIRKGRAV